MVLLRYFLILISLGILFSSDETATEKAGDIMQLAIPLAGLGSTYVIDDKIGKKQFWKSYLSTAFLTYFLKITINRERPSGGGWSFPSGHTASAFSGAMFINNLRIADPLQREHKHKCRFVCKTLQEHIFSALL